MVESAYLASALATGVLLLAVWAVVSRAGDQRRYEVLGAGSDRDGAAWSESIAAWSAAFFALLLAAGGGAVVLVSGASLPIPVGPIALVGLFGALLVGYLLLGTYQSARGRGLRSSQAALLSAWLFGSLVLAAIVAELLLGG